MKKKVIVIVSIGPILGVGIRIYYINKTARKPVYEYYALDEWVDYNGSYQIGANENTKGYYARVLDATFMTYKEYVEKYGFSLDTLPNMYKDSLSKEKVEDIYNLGMIDVQIEYRNDSSIDGHMALSESKIFALEDNIYYGICEPLLDLKIPELAGGMGYFFSLKPNGESVILNVPYALPIYSDGEFGKETGNFPKYLTITQNPVRKFVEIPVKNER